MKKIKLIGKKGKACPRFCEKIDHYFSSGGTGINGGCLIKKYLEDVINDCHHVKEDFCIEFPPEKQKFVGRVIRD